MRYKFQKKAQVTQFIIIGVIILIAFGFYLYTNRSLEKARVIPKIELEYGVSSVKAFTTSCVSKLLVDALDKGDCGLKDTNCINNYINSNLKDCTDFSAFEEKGFVIYAGNPATTTTLTADELNLYTNVNYPITIKKGVSETDLIEFYSELNVKAPLTISTDSNGVTLNKITFTSADRDTLLVIPAGTRITDENGNPILNPEMTITMFDNRQPDPAVIGYITYDIKPDGARFDPAIELTIEYKENHLPAGQKEQDLRIAWWDKNGQLWRFVPSTVDTINNKVTGKVNHFTEFTVAFGCDGEDDTIIIETDWVYIQQLKECDSIKTADRDEDKICYDNSGTGTLLYTEDPQEYLGSTMDPNENVYLVDCDITSNGTVTRQSYGYSSVDGAGGSGTFEFTLDSGGCCSSVEISAFQIVGADVDDFIEKITINGKSLKLKDKAGDVYSNFGTSAYQPSGLSPKYKGFSPSENNPLHFYYTENNENITWMPDSGPTKLTVKVKNTKLACSHAKFKLRITGCGSFRSEQVKITTCTEMGGVKCSPRKKKCSVDLIETKDTSYCCLGECRLKTCQEREGKICADGETCLGGEFEETLDSNRCCIEGECTLLLSCDGLGGTPCSSFQNCIGNFIDSSDYGTGENARCCIGICNAAPILSSIGDLTIYQNSYFNKQLVADDVDNDDLTFSADHTIIDSHLDSSTGLISFTPDQEDVGVYSVKITVSDGILTDSETIAFTVIDVNDPPIINLPDSITFLEDTEYILNLSNYATDADGDCITWYAISSEHITVTIDNTISTFTPDANWNGQEKILLIAGDGSSNSSANLTVIVNPVSDYPWISPAVLDQTKPEDSGTWALDLTDNENDVEDSGTDLTWSISGVDTSLITYSLDTTTDELTFTTIQDSFGVNTITLTLTDSSSLTAEQDLTITITNVNNPPIVDLTALSPINIPSGGPSGIFDLDEYVEDIDNEDSELNWYYSGNICVNIIINSEHEVTLQHQELLGCPSNETITFKAKDPDGDSDSDSITVNIT